MEDVLKGDRGARAKAKREEGRIQC